MRLAGGYAGAYVADVSEPTPSAVFRWREHRARILASNTKLFTTSGGARPLRDRRHARHRGPGDGRARPRGVYRGSLYLRGGGDPTFGSRRFTRRSYGGGATVQDLADAARRGRHPARHRPDLRRRVGLRLASRRPRLGLRRLDLGRPAERLSYNRGLFTERGRGFQANPPAFAAARLDDALEARHIPVRRSRAPA